jgi:hypothetical protein
MKKLMYRVSGLLLIVLLNSAEVLANTGIAYLFVIPYLSVAVIAYFWYRNSRRQLRERQMVAARVRQAMEGTDQ